MPDWKNGLMVEGPEQPLLPDGTPFSVEMHLLLAAVKLAERDGYAPARGKAITDAAMAAEHAMQIVLEHGGFPDG